MSNKTIICIIGPTAVGKTDLAIKITRDLPCEIISVDSGMIYRTMDIGTAKPTPTELSLAPHHLVDICDPKDLYSAAYFRKDALLAIEEILHKKKIPLLVGGSMLYFKILLEGVSPLPNADPDVRAQIAKEAEICGWKFLHKKLQIIDPISAAKISSSDSQRIQRALEVYQLTGKNISELCAMNPPQTLPYKTIKIALIPNDKNLLRKKIALRFKNMLQSGFIEEVARLYNRGDLHPDLPSMRAVGYRQIWNYLTKKTNYDEMCEEAINATNQLAKRQMTWLRNWKDLQQFDANDDNLKNKIVELIENDYQIA